MVAHLFGTHRTWNSFCDTLNRCLYRSHNNNIFRRIIFVQVISNSHPNFVWYTSRVALDGANSSSSSNGKLSFSIFSQINCPVDNGKQDRRLFVNLLNTMANGKWINQYYIVCHPTNRLVGIDTCLRQFSACKTIFFVLYLILVFAIAIEMVYHKCIFSRLLL